MTGRLLLIAGGLGALFAIGLLADNYLLRLAATACMYAALALSWNLVGGFAGYPSFATAAFFGLGAYASGVAQGFGAPFWLAWGGAGALAAVFAAGLGGAILHLKGHYFAIASLVVADVLRELCNSWTDVTGGGMGLNLPLIALGGPRAQAAFYFAAFAAVAAFALVVAWGVSRSRLGVALRCIAENESAAPLIGVATRSAKVKAFTLSGLIGGLTGAVYASWVTYIDPTDVFDVLLSVKPIIMALIGGVGTLFGPVVGAVVFLGLEELIWRNVLEFHAGLLGLVVVALVLFLPAGLSGARPWGLVRLARRRFGAGAR
ncbi:branched-chain amino acid ABC transporter permease [Methylopila musalis]|uniref:Branched-chain amino acid ABC transporter permease n=1 Tax=Methylopila musalis TaxID=1134781 RepID=A0ABW3Z2Y4_9HYPH